MKKRIVALTLSLSMLLSCITVYASELPACGTELDAVRATEEVNECISELDDVVGLDTISDEIIYDEEDIYDICEEININTVNAFYESVGMDTITTDEMAEMFVEGLEAVNENLEKGELEILDNGTIVETDDDNFYLQGGSTYDKTYWWGRRRYKSTRAADTWAYHLQNCAAANAAVSVLAGAVFSGVGAIPNGLCSAYCWALGNKISYVNSTTTRGIKADIYWCLVYKVTKQ